MNTASPSSTLNSAATDDKTAAIVSYLTLFGFIAAIVIHNSRKTRLGSYHLRQMLGLMLTGIVVWIAATACMFLPLIGWLVGLAAWGGLFGLWVMGLIAALNGQPKPVPVLGESFQKWFGAAFD